MFFLCETGQKTSGPGSETQLSIWRDDNFIFFGDGRGGMHSLQIEDAELAEFCSFLEEGGENEDYIEFKDREDGDIYIALEEDDEGSRNLCLMDKRMDCMFNLKTRVLPLMAAFLRKHIK